ncbi:MAG TPA: VOC family protein [Polyangia bacterium]|jgi:methylmalonyl-CoA/ethylmalonyl-CoA epimerase
MIRVKRIDHVAIAVADRDAGAAQLQSVFALVAGAREHVAGQKTDVAFLHTDGADEHGGACDAAAVEVISPAGNPTLEKFLARRGPGLHHICFEVDDLPAALAELKAAGVRLIDEAPRIGARGHLVAFLHPSATGGVLFELCAAAPAAATIPSVGTASS